MSFELESYTAENVHDQQPSAVICCCCQRWAESFLQNFSSAETVDVIFCRITLGRPKETSGRLHSVTSGSSSVFFGSDSRPQSSCVHDRYCFAQGQQDDDL